MTARTLKRSMDPGVLTGVRPGALCTAPAPGHRSCEPSTLQPFRRILLACVALENKDAALARFHQITRTNLAILGEWVTGRDDITYVKPVSGTTALLRYNAPIGSYEFCTRLLGETGVMFLPAPPATSSTPSASASPTTPGPCAPAWIWSAGSSTASPRTDSRQEGERSPAMGEVTARTVTRLQEHGSTEC